MVTCLWKLAGPAVLGARVGEAGVSVCVCVCVFVCVSVSLVARRPCRTWCTSW